MICDHLRPLFEELVAASMPEQFVHPPPPDVPPKPRTRWYFDCILDLERLRERMSLPDFVVDDGYWGTHLGEEQGFHCERDDMWLMGHHPNYLGVKKVPRFK